MQWVFVLCTYKWVDSCSIIAQVVHILEEIELHTFTWVTDYRLNLHDYAWSQQATELYVHSHCKWSTCAYIQVSMKNNFFTQPFYAKI